jgi:hypothetical protein
MTQKRGNEERARKEGRKDTVKREKRQGKERGQWKK